MTFQILKAVTWILLVGTLVVLLWTPAMFGFSDELLRSVISTFAALVVALFLAAQFLLREKVYIVPSVINVALFFVAGILILSTTLSMSPQHSLFGFSMEMGTVASFVVLYILYVAGRNAFGTEHSVAMFLRVLDVSLIALVLLTVGFGLVGVERMLFDVFDLGVFSGLVLLLSILRFEYTKSIISSLVVAAVAYAGLLIGNDRSLQIAVVLGILFIITLKVFARGASSRIPYFSGFALACVSVLFFFPGQPIVSLGQTSDIRPSWEATRTVMAGAVVDNPARAMIGTGPNTFSYAWNLYKPEAINSTPVWNVPFRTGVSGFATLFVAIGLLGSVAVVILALSAAFVGTRRLLLGTDSATHTYFICTALIAFVYGFMCFVLQVPSIALLAIAFVFLGLLHSLAEPRYSARMPSAVKMFAGAVLIAVISTASFFIIVKAYHTLSFERQVLAFNETGDTQHALATVTCAEKYIDHSVCYRFLSELQRNHIQTLFASEDTLITEGEASMLSADMLLNAQQAVAMNRADYRNWLVLGNAYTQLAVMGAGDGLERGTESYDKAIALAPKDPFVLLLKAQLVYYLGGNENAARLATQKALELKPEYDPALSFLETLNSIRE